MPKQWQQEICDFSLQLFQSSRIRILKKKKKKKTRKLLNNCPGNTNKIENHRNNEQNAKTTTHGGPEDAGECTIRLTSPENLPCTAMAGKSHCMWVSCAIRKVACVYHPPVSYVCHPPIHWSINPYPSTNHQSSIKHPKQNLLSAKLLHDFNTLLNLFFFFFF